MTRQGGLLHGPDDNGSFAEDDVDERFRALLEGLRTTLPGAQVLLGFLLVLPFQSSFPDLSNLNRSLYLMAFFFSAMSSVLLIAPSVHQRVRAPMSGIARSSKDDVESAVRVSLVGTGFLGLAITTSTLLVARAADAGTIPLIGVVAVVGAIAYTWLLQPLVIFERRGSGRARRTERS